MAPLSQSNKFVLAVLMIILAGFAGRVVWFMAFKANPPANTNANIANTNIPNNNIATNVNVNGQIDISNWQTYRNEDLGIRFQYPDGWNIELLSDKVIKLFDQKSQYYNEYLKENVLPFSVYIRRDTKPLTQILQNIEKDATENGALPINFSELKTTEVIDGSTAIIIKPYSNAEGSSTISYALIEKGSSVFIIEGLEQFTDKDFFRTFPSIYKTFRLLVE